MGAAKPAAIASEVGPYLQARLIAWLAEDASRDAATLGKLVGLSKATMSQLKVHARLGPGAANLLGPVFGFRGHDDLVAAARTWAAQQRPASVPPPSTATVRLPTSRHEQLALAAALAEDDGASEEAVRSVLAERPTDRIFRVAMKMVRRELELAAEKPAKPRRS